MVTLYHDLGTVNEDGRFDGFAYMHTGNKYF